MEEYNGYYNYNVWNVMLWLDNEADIYKKKETLFNDYYDKKISEKKFMQGINQLGRAAHMRSDIKKEKLTKEEIEELRKDIKSQYKEHAEYRQSQGK